jgi:membrane-bound lytic murein transglycosylase D
VDSAIRRTGYADFWELRRMHALPLATANYVPVILAMAIMAKNMDAYDLAVEYDAPIDYDTVPLESETHIALAAAAVDRPITELKSLNPALLRSVAPKGYTLRVPKDTRAKLEEAFEVIPPAQRDEWRIHRVEDGDTLAGIAKKYKVSVAQLSAANNGTLPEPGAFAAVPAAYPGDPVPKKKVVAKATKGKGSKKSTSKSTSAKATTGKTVKIAATKKPAAPKTKLSSKAAAKTPTRASTKSKPTSSRAGA